MTPLDFLLGVVLVILGFTLLGFSLKLADRLPLLALMPYAMRQIKEPIRDILVAIGLFSTIMGAFILLAMLGSTLLAKGVLLFFH